MTIEEAIKLIKECAAQMDSRYGKTVFDEWAVVSMRENRGRLLAYSGPRKEGFQKNFLHDAGPLRAGLLVNEPDTGDFEFARHGVGTGFEAFMVVGPGIYMICNNTRASMENITSEPQWLGAQVPFVELSDTFRNDPVALPSYQTESFAKAGV
jgi:hypothetical protein